MATVLSPNIARDGFMVSNERPATDSNTSGAIDEVIGNLADRFKLLADETRLRIVHFLLNHEELNVRTLCGKLGQSQPAVSHHLALLKSAGMIECRRDGKHNFYHLMPQRFGEINELFGRIGPGKNLRIDLPSQESQPSAHKSTREVTADESSQA